MTVSIIIKGMSNVIDMINQKGHNTREEIRKAMIKIGGTMEGEVKKSIAGYKESEPHIVGTEHISVDTGMFQNSVSFSAGQDYAIIYSNIKYAKKLEYGIGYHLSPRAHFRNAKYRNKQKCIDIMQGNINNI